MNVARCDYSGSSRSFEVGMPHRVSQHEDGNEPALGSRGWISILVEQGPHGRFTSTSLLGVFFAQFGAYTLCHTLCIQHEPLRFILMGILGLLMWLAAMLWLLHAEIGGHAGMLRSA